jgi:hypothetical protein
MKASEQFSLLDDRPAAVEAAVAGRREAMRMVRFGSSD